MRRRRFLLPVLVLSLVALYHRAWTQAQQCRLTITLVDSQTQKPIPGVIRCLPQDGNQAIPVTNLLARGQGLNDKSSIQDWYVLLFTDRSSSSTSAAATGSFFGIGDGTEKRFGRSDRAKSKKPHDSFALVQPGFKAELVWR